MHIGDTPYIIELLTPKQNDESFEEKLQRFAERYRRILEHGAVVSICDNPLGNLHFTAMEPTFRMSQTDFSCIKPTGDRCLT
jgi:hypothetical protein